jgi:SAM-dependent methyltransferase
MTAFEIAYLAAEPFLLPLHRQFRRRVLQFTTGLPRPEILDVGGRKSHYTIGVPGAVTITDLPRETNVQRQLHLGITPFIMNATRTKRSNVRDVRLDDMTRSLLPDASFDCVLAVEVLEHVEEDAKFVAEVCRVLKAGGVFLMTTPNGDSVANTNPDHKRHYTREQLYRLLASRFGRVEVDYAIRGGRSRSLGLRSWSIRHPLRTVVAMAANVVNGVQSADPRVKDDARATRHLVASAWKQDYASTAATSN